ncbi:MAG: hypothetical protein KJ587_11145 [Alphaproteobacteria bacterium]|nr:hypothetical protein [Alphaproteobacteria bacterium]
MAMTYMTEHKSRLESRERAKAEYRMIFALSFAFFLVLAVLARIAGLIQLPFSGPRERRKPLVVEAREAANSVLPYAFMG